MNMFLEHVCMYFKLVLLTEQADKYQAQNKKASTFLKTNLLLCANILVYMIIFFIPLQRIWTIFLLL